VHLVSTRRLLGLHLVLLVRHNLECQRVLVPVMLGIQDKMAVLVRHVLRQRTSRYQEALLVHSVEVTFGVQWRVHLFRVVHLHVLQVARELTVHAHSVLPASTKVQVEVTPARTVRRELGPV
jgi:hypothetical protein